MAEPERDPGGYTRSDETKRADQRVLTRILKDRDIFGKEERQRQQILSELEKDASEDERSVGCIAFMCADTAGIEAEDIPAIGDALLSIGDVDQLDLIISGPGGDGTIAEKIVSLCRCYCDRFRVIVPSRAKSAATIVALGADNIVMGPWSELGPIDAQVLTIVGGIPRYISAQSFIDARDNLETRYLELKAKGQDTQHILQQLASLDPSFIDHCEKLMGFSRDVATKFLERYMFRSVPKRQRANRIEKVVESLLSVSMFKVHGRMITGNVAKTELGLDVQLVPKDHKYWHGIWKYFVHADALLSRGGKMVETRNGALLKVAPEVLQ